MLILDKGLTCLLVHNNILSIGLVMLEGGTWNHASDEEDACKCTPPTLCN